jgi:hypothetical protein
MLQNSFNSFLVSLPTQMVGALATTHGVLEITGAGVNPANQKYLVSIGTKVNDSTLPRIQGEGGALYVSVFLQEMLPPHQHSIIRRLTPTFSAEVNRRKLIAFQAGTRTGPVWIAWSQGAWRHFHTEADRDLLFSVFSDPLTTQNITQLLKTEQSVRAPVRRAVTRRSGPYDRPLQGSAPPTQNSIQQFFAPRDLSPAE